MLCAKVPHIIIYAYGYNVVKCMHILGVYVWKHNCVFIYALTPLVK